MPEESRAFVSNLKIMLSKEVTIFGSAAQMTSGLGMERIWRYFKPNTPKSQKQLSAILSLENLADRLDAAMWKSSLRIDEMAQIRERFSSSLELVRKQDVDVDELLIVGSISMKRDLLC